MWTIRDVHSGQPPGEAPGHVPGLILTPDDESRDGKDRVGLLVNTKQAPQPENPVTECAASASSPRNSPTEPEGPLVEDGLACFICDVHGEDGLLSIFQADAVREQLKERLEGVLAVTLEECQPSGQSVCVPCRNTLVNIETMAAGLRRAYQTTLYRHRCQDNFEMDFPVLTDSLNPLEYYSGDVRQLQFHLPPSEEGATMREDTGDMPTGVVSTLPDATTERTNLKNDLDAEPSEKPVRTKEPSGQQTIYDQDTDSGAELESGVMVSPEEPAGKQEGADDVSPVQTSQKRKSTKPQRVLAEEESGNVTELSMDGEDSVDYDDEDYLENTDEDDDFLPNGQALHVEVIVKRKRGRPKGSKNKSKSVRNMKKLLGTSMKIKPKKRIKRDIGGMCDNCDKIFLSNYKLNRHKLIHSNARPFGCPQCTQQFKAKYHLDRHLQIHSGVRPHPCPQCSATFRERHQLAEHQLTHTGETPHVCEQCAQRFQKATALKQHMYEHTGMWPFKCSICNTGFVREAELKEHATMHTGEKPFRCTECGDSFRLANTLKVHMRRHTGIKPYGCKLCSARFAAANTLKEHLRTHSGVRKFLCDTCGAAFVHQSGLVQHSKTHLAVEERRHVCQFCQRRFNELSLLKRHQRIHTGERPYMCSKCGKAFRRPGELSMHYRYHSNDRRHICVTCSKSFFTKSHLKRHQATHSGSSLSDGGLGISGSVCNDMPDAPLYPSTAGIVSKHSPPLTIHPLLPPHHHTATITTAVSAHYAADPVIDHNASLVDRGVTGGALTLHPCMICSKQFLHVDHLTRHIARVHAPGMSLEEQLTSVTAIEEYTNPYSAEDLGLPYMTAINIMPQ